MMYLEITVPLGGLGFGRRTLPPDTRIEFERTAAVAGRRSPTLLISGDGVDAVALAFRESESVEDISVFTDTGAGRIYRIEWGDPPKLIHEVRRVNGTILEATATSDTWSLDLRFPTQEAATRFYGEYYDPERPITVHYTNRSEPPRERQDGDLTSPQREALERALQTGYFDVPRKTTLTQLARDLNISDSAVSQRLRRGLSNVLQPRIDTDSAAVESVGHGD